MPDDNTIPEARRGLISDKDAFAYMKQVHTDYEKSLSGGDLPGVVSNYKRMLAFEEKVVKPSGMRRRLNHAERSYKQLGEVEKADRFSQLSPLGFRTQARGVVIDGQPVRIEDLMSSRTASGLYANHGLPMDIGKQIEAGFMDPTNNPDGVAYGKFFNGPAKRDGTVATSMVNRYRDFKTLASSALTIGGDQAAAPDEQTVSALASQMTITQMNLGSIGVSDEVFTKGFEGLQMKFREGMKARGETISVEDAKDISSRTVAIMNQIKTQGAAEALADFASYEGGARQGLSNQDILLGVTKQSELTGSLRNLSEVDSDFGAAVGVLARYESGLYSNRDETQRNNALSVLHNKLNTMTGDNSVLTAFQSKNKAVLAAAITGLGVGSQYTEGIPGIDAVDSNVTAATAEYNAASSALMGGAPPDAAKGVADFTYSLGSALDSETPLADKRSFAVRALRSLSKVQPLTPAQDTALKTLESYGGQETPQGETEEARVLRVSKLDPYSLTGQSAGAAAVLRAKEGMTDAASEITGSITDFLIKSINKKPAEKLALLQSIKVTVPGAGTIPLSAIADIDPQVRTIVMTAANKANDSNPWLQKAIGPGFAAAAALRERFQDITQLTLPKELETDITDPNRIGADAARSLWDSGALTIDSTGGFIVETSGARKSSGAKIGGVDYNYDDPQDLAKLFDIVFEGEMAPAQQNFYSAQKKLRNIRASRYDVLVNNSEAIAKNISSNVSAGGIKPNRRVSKEEAVALQALGGNPKIVSRAVVGGMSIDDVLKIKKFEQSELKMRQDREMAERKLAQEDVKNKTYVEQKTLDRELKRDLAE